ncbi:MAG: ArsR/SmtB family transcription factor [Bacillota bacterium]
MENNISKFNEMAEILKALAHPIRLCIVAGLIEKGQCNVSHMQSCMEMPQSTVSQHLQKLRAAGIIEGTRNGLEITYKVKDEKIKKIMKILEE